MRPNRLWEAMITWDDLQKRGCPRCRKPFGKIERDLRGNERSFRALCGSRNCFAACFTDEKLVCLEWYLSTENAVFYYTSAGLWGNVSDGHLSRLFKPFKWRIGLEDLYDHEDSPDYTDGVLETVWEREKKLCKQCRKEHQ